MVWDFGLDWMRSPHHTPHYLPPAPSHTHTPPPVFPHHTSPCLPLCLPTPHLASCLPTPCPHFLPCPLPSLPPCPSLPRTPPPPAHTHTHTWPLPFALCLTSAPTHTLLPPHTPHTYPHPHHTCLCLKQQHPCPHTHTHVLRFALSFISERLRGMTARRARRCFTRVISRAGTLARINAHVCAACARAQHCAITVRSARHPDARHACARARGMHTIILFCGRASPQRGIKRFGCRCCILRAMPRCIYLCRAHTLRMHLHFSFCTFGFVDGRAWRAVFLRTLLLNARIQRAARAWRARRASRIASALFSPLCTLWLLARARSGNALRYIGHRRHISGYIACCCGARRASTFCALGLYHAISFSPPF